MKCGNSVLIMTPLYISFKYVEVGDKVFIRNNARIEGVDSYEGESFNPRILIHDNVSIEQNLHLTCATKITIGSDTAIASNVSITDINHPYENIELPPEKQGITSSEVSIGSNCKIYNNVVILPGTHLGKHNVVGANSVVLGKTYPDFCIIVGSPAKIIKRYSFNDKEWLKTDPEGNFIN